MTSLERIRLGKRLTRKQLAKKAGVAVQTIWNLEQRRFDARDGTLFKLADALGCEPTDLIEAPEPTEPAKAAA